MANVPDGTLGPDFPSQASTIIFTADKVGLYINQQFSDLPGIAESLKLEIHKDLLGNMIAQMRAWIVSGRIPTNEQKKTVQWPDGCWQMFKETYAPLWFKKKFPVRWHTEEFTVQTNHYFVCPHLAGDPTSRHIQFMAIGSPLAGEMRHRGY